jgi:hypothetical protein
MAKDATAHGAKLGPFGIGSYNHWVKMPFMLFE